MANNKAKLACNARWRAKNKEKIRKYNQQYLAAHPDTRRGRKRDPKKAQDQLRRHRAKNPGGRRFENIRRKYGITEEQYNAMFNAQNGLCAICGQPPNKRPLFVDHDHETGIVRGLLCYHCNTGIGYFRDDFTLLSLATRYLGRFAH